MLKEAAGEAMDEVSARSLAVHAVMEKAGASKEEIEEMMAMMMSKGGGISKDFLANITQAMESGGEICHKKVCFSFSEELALHS